MRNSLCIGRVTQFGVVSLFPRSVWPRHGTAQCSAHLTQSHAHWHQEALQWQERLKSRGTNKLSIELTNIFMMLVGTKQYWMSEWEENRETNQFSVISPSPPPQHNNRQQLSNSRQQRPQQYAVCAGGENFKTGKNLNRKNLKRSCCRF